MKRRLFKPRWRKPPRWRNAAYRAAHFPNTNHMSPITTDYRIPEARHLPGSPESRADHNMQVIALLKQLIASGNRPTSSEADLLASYVGWGACPQIFAENTLDWKGRAKRLQGLLTTEEYDHARRSTVNAHYTSTLVVDAIWRALMDLGAKPGMKWLEPAVGVGNFFGRQPESLLPGATRVGLDKDTITASIAKLLYPQADIRLQALESALLPDGYFDAAVSNVPFANFGVYDPAYKQPFLTKSIHNYFLVKALDLVRPGGIIAFVTSRFTMDSYDNAHKGIREYLAARALFLGAVRLPASAFKQVAGTEVVTDIIFLRKRLPGTKPLAGEPEWTDTRWNGESYSSYSYKTNAYFAQHPSLVLGTQEMAWGRYSTREYSVKGDLTPEHLANGLKLALNGHGFVDYKPTTAVAAPVLALAQDITAKIGAYFIEKRRLYRRIALNKVETVKVAPKAKQRIEGQMELRDSLQILLRAEREDAPESEIAQLRATLNRQYDAYVKTHGPLSNRMNQAALHGDPDAPLVLSLERGYNEDAGTAQKAPVLLQRVIAPLQSVTHCATAPEALTVSLNETGRIDWDRMAELTGKAVTQLQDDLSQLVFLIPGSDNQWETADAYLSGPVRTKLRVAREHAALDPRFTPNVQALENAQPEDIPPGQIAATLGVTWVPLNTYGAFVKEVLSLDKSAKVRYVAGEFHIDNTWAGKTQWDTDKVPALRLLADCMNLRRTKVYKHDPEDYERMIIDQMATMAARDRQQDLNEHFGEWLFSETERAEAMTQAYNEKVNNLRLRTFDGSHLTLPGMSRVCLRNQQLYPHQLSGVWRIICQKMVYLAQCVGAGKTYVMIAAAMELKRLGLIRRPMFVVPNSTLSGWQEQFFNLYPSANVLVFSEKDLEKSKRQQVMAQIASGVWDAVVVPESSFQMIPVGPALFQDAYDKLEAQLTEAISEAKAEDLPTKFIKRLEKQKERLLKKLKERQGKHKDHGVFWEDMAIDMLFVDEAMSFKKLGFSTKQSMIAGIDANGNQKTFDLQMKIRYIQQNDGRVTFACGTPVTNTLGELFNIMHTSSPMNSRTAPSLALMNGRRRSAGLWMCLSPSPRAAVIKPRGGSASLSTYRNCRSCGAASRTCSPPTCWTYPSPLWRRVSARRSLTSSIPHNGITWRNSKTAPGVAGSIRPMLCRITCWPSTRMPKR